MIICHPSKLIFIKTKKVGGTSFEIALSRYCSEDCVITPISPEDEATRKELGFRGPQNYRAEKRVGLGRDGHANNTIRNNFRNHKPAEVIHRQIGDEIFSQYTKISIHRNPLDFLISLYFYQLKGKDPKTKPFGDWFSKNRHQVHENERIAPRNGPYACDVVFRYEELHKQIAEYRCLPDGFLETFLSINAKGNYRKNSSKDARKFFTDRGLATELDELLASCEQSHLAAK